MVAQIKEAFSLQFVAQIVTLLLIGSGVIYTNKGDIRVEAEARRAEDRALELTSQASDERERANWERQNRINDIASMERKELTSNYHIVNLATQDAGQKYTFILELFREEKNENSIFRKDMRQFASTCVTTEDYKDGK